MKKQEARIEALRYTAGAARTVAETVIARLHDDLKCETKILIEMWNVIAELERRADQMEKRARRKAERG